MSTAPLNQRGVDMRRAARASISDIRLVTDITPSGCRRRLAAQQNALVRRVTIC
jgi:hypothetical protein